VTQPRALDETHLLSELRDLVAGLRHHLEEERATGLEGWPKGSGPSRKKAPPSPPPSSPSLTLEGVREELETVGGVSSTPPGRISSLAREIPGQAGLRGEGPGRTKTSRGNPSSAWPGNSSPRSSRPFS